jgi:ATP-dependent DNA helicase RecG
MIEGQELDKKSLVWEIQTNQKVPGNKFDQQKLEDFIEDIKKSERVSNFIKEKSVDELLEYYLFVKGDYLTNLGVLWIGQREDRAILLHAPTIQFIKYNQQDEKIKKIAWDDFYLNPIELLNAVLTEIPECIESFACPFPSFLNFEHLNFVFVSDFDIRISDLLVLS